MRRTDIAMFYGLKHGRAARAEVRRITSSSIMRDGALVEDLSGQRYIVTGLHSHRMDRFDAHHYTHDVRRPYWYERLWWWARGY